MKDLPRVPGMSAFSHAAKLLAMLPEIGANAYANGGIGMGQPIVSRHFTAGNQARYSWPPLSRGYFLAKAAGLVSKGGGAKVFLDRDERNLSPAHRKELAASRRGSKVDPNAEFQSSTGEMMGIGAGANLPMLVLYGKLRDAVCSRSHKIVKTGDVAVCVFSGLPEYALAHHNGLGHMPKRSPVEPNSEDAEATSAVMEKWLSAQLGTGGRVPISSDSVPNVARVSM